MNRHFSSKFFEINEFIFPFLVFFAYLSLLVEAYKYIGFLSKHIFFDSRYFLILALVSGVLLMGRKQNIFCVLTFKINNFFVLPISVVVYLIMQFLESFYFNNYVFSTYHLQPSIFFYIVVFCFVLFIISKLRSDKSSRFDILLLILPILFIDNLTKVLDSAINSDIFIVTHINFSYSDKMRESWGIYYNFTQFIKENTPENSSILIPPQGYPWFLTSNIGFDRYFLYPRNLINGGEKDSGVNLDNIDYVLIDYGETTISQYGFTNIWPKFNVNGKYIIYWNPSDGSTRQFDSGKYVYNAKDNINQWGIIQLK